MALLCSSHYLWASPQWYIGGNALLLNAKGTLTTNGSFNNVLDLLQGNPRSAGFFQLQDNSTLASQQLSLESDNNPKFGMSGVVGLSWPFNQQFSLALQIDAATGAGKAKYFQEAISSAYVLINDTLMNIHYQIYEKYRENFGVDLMPMWHVYTYPYPSHFRQASLFVLAGYRYGAFNSNLELTSQATGTTILRSNTWRHGLDIGVGAQVSLDMNLDLRLMAGQTYYKKQSIFTQSTAVSWQAASSARIDQISLGLLWHT